MTSGTRTHGAPAVAPVSMSFLITGAAAALALLLGVGIVGHSTLVFAIVMGVVALPLVNARPAIWIGLALGVSWTSRLLTTTGIAPRFLDFMDFPLVIAAFLVAVVGHLAGDRALSVGQRSIVRRLALVAVVLTVSWAFNDLAEPQRLLAGVVFALEPFLLLVAVMVAPTTAVERRRLMLLTLVLLCGQLPFSLVQIGMGGVADDVKGTLLEAGAGHHVSAGGLALGFFLLAGLRVRKVLLFGFGVAALLVIVVSDAKQVLFALPLALLVLGVSRNPAASGAMVARGVFAGVLMAALSVYALVAYASSTSAFDFIERAGTNRTGKVAVVDALWEDVSSAPPSLAFGLGPGQTVSRFAFLTTPALLKEGSPVTVLGLEASRGAEEYDRIAFGGRFTGNSSFTSAQSSALGVLGDYGLAGVAAFTALVLSVLRSVRREGERHLRAAALASWALLLPLAVVFDWMEQPPFTLAIMVITGLALRTERTADSEPSKRSGSIEEPARLIGATPGDRHAPRQ